MTTTTTDQTTRTEPPLTPCPPWCEYGHLPHLWDDETTDGRLARNHVMEWNIEASQDKPTEYGHQPDAFVCLIQPEILGWDAGQADTGEVRVGVDVSSFPHFTLAEARQVIAALATATEKGEELQGAKAARLPEASDVAALTALLDMMANFPSNEQRARYLLSSNWMRDRGAAAAARVGSGK